MEGTSSASCQYLHFTGQPFCSPDGLLGHPLRDHGLLPDRPHALRRHPLPVRHLLADVEVPRLVGLPDLFPDDAHPQPFPPDVQLIDGQPFLAFVAFLARGGGGGDHFGEGLVVDEQRVLAQLV